jgi:hypothetical protein
MPEKTLVEPASATSLAQGPGLYGPIFKVNAFALACRVVSPGVF